jgi:drug/metabolite transporter (DMT)-like permease
VRAYWPLLILLASIWGASYLFIKVAVDDIPPAAMTDLRLLIAGVMLLGYLGATTGLRSSVRELRAARACESCAQPGCRASCSAS